MSLFKKTKNMRSSKPLKNPQILDLNLIKDELELSFDWRRGSKLIVFSLLLFIFLLAELYWGLDWWAKDEQTRLNYVQQRIETVKQDSQALQVAAKDALSYQDRTKLVGDLLDNHIYWTGFFAWLEKNTLSSVSFDGFSGSVDGVYNLSGRANSFAEVSWQVQQLLSDPLVLKAEVTAVNSFSNKSEEQYYRELSLQMEAMERGEDVAPVSLPESGVGFSLALSINPEIFKK